MRASIYFKKCLMLCLLLVLPIQSCGTKATNPDDQDLQVVSFPLLELEMPAELANEDDIQADLKLASTNESTAYESSATLLRNKLNFAKAMPYRTKFILILLNAFIERINKGKLTPGVVVSFENDEGYSGVVRRSVSQAILNLCYEERPILYIFWDEETKKFSITRDFIYGEPETSSRSDYRVHIDVTSRDRGLVYAIQQSGKLWDGVGASDTTGLELFEYADVEINSDNTIFFSALNGWSSTDGELPSQVSNFLVIQTTSDTAGYYAGNSRDSHPLVCNASQQQKLNTIMGSGSLNSDDSPFCIGATYAPLSLDFLSGTELLDKWSEVKSKVDLSKDKLTKVEFPDSFSCTN